MKKFALILILFITASAAVSAQGGSNYTLFGIGSLNNTVGSNYESVGGTSIAYPLDNSINTRNPALWATLGKTRLQIGYRFNQKVINSDKSTLWQNNGKINGINGVFAIDSSLGISVGFGLNPYSSINYYIANATSAFLGNTEVFGNTYFQGIGGLDRAHLGGSVRLPYSLSLGVESYAFFGKNESYTETGIFGDFNRNMTFEIDGYRGWGTKVGLYWDNIENLGIGAFFEYNDDLQVRSQVVYLSDTYEDSTFFCDNNYAMPPALGIGASYKTGKFLLGADLSMQDFTNFKYRPPANGNFRNNIKLSFGASRLGNRGLGTYFLDKITYNFGLSYQQHYIELYAGDSGNLTGIDELSGTFGFLIPLPGSAMISSAFQIGVLGTTESGLLQEYFGRLSVNISIGETWFQPFDRGF